MVGARCRADHTARVAESSKKGKIVTRENSGVQLGDLNSARTLGVLLTPPGSRVLDVGGATGQMARALVERGCEVWGIDTDATAAAEAGRWC